ncbi:methanogenic corrinoid protein MtbC1 [Motilibacter peucedani]|uniref:Methanogenic corrinoid protein MtbC1 n=1 Tax=Motilibacter peucedani TaxID=598650 RepID=A0A420XK75_9ACTN|nr:cobalamin B12-binding domain-containing protein [Motilibacter peucedani]RKS68033.1 methanogenic corrinoid protein MtbC1 [Motilibacter peucedani]
MTGSSGEFLAALSALSRRGAVEVVVGARAGGAAVGTLVADVFAPAEREVGLRWERDEWSVAQEHAATVIAELALSAVSQDGHDRVHGRLVAACVSGEWHAFPVRLVAESLRDLGWSVTCLGGSVPADQLEGFLREHRPDAVLLSATLAASLPGALESVAAARRAGVPAVLGGAAADAYPAAAAAVGAHAAPSDVLAVHDLLERLVGSPPLPEPPGAQAQQRCRDLHSERPALVDALGGAASALPAAAGSLLAPLVDTLAAAALLGDTAPLDDFTDWLTGVVRVRGGDPAAVDALVQALRREAAPLVPELGELATAGVRRG